MSDTQASVADLTDEDVARFNAAGAVAKRARGTDRTFGVQETAAIVGVSRARIEGWLTRGVFEPLHAPAPPEPRRYTLVEVFQLFALADLHDSTGLPLDLLGGMACSLAAYAPGSDSRVDLAEAYGFGDQRFVVVFAGIVHSGKGKPSTFHSCFTLHATQAASLFDVLADPQLNRLTTIVVQVTELRRRFKRALVDATAGHRVPGE